MTNREAPWCKSVDGVAGRYSGLIHVYPRVQCALDKLHPYAQNDYVRSVSTSTGRQYSYTRLCGYDVAQTYFALV